MGGRERTKEKKWIAQTLCKACQKLIHTSLFFYDILFFFIAVTSTPLPLYSQITPPSSVEIQQTNKTSTIMNQPLNCGEYPSGIHLLFYAL